MATYTARLGLKRNDGTDPFKRQDFTDNYNRLDAAPGVHVCTSSTRPTWASGQAGRLIFETDTNSFYHWNGTTFVDPLSTPSTWAGSVGPNATLAPNAVASYTYATINAPRASNLTIVGSARVSATGSNLAGIGITPLVDAAPVGMTGQFYTQWILRDGTPYYDHREVIFYAFTSISAGSHTLGGRMEMSGYPQSVLVSWVRGVAWMSKSG